MLFLAVSAKWQYAISDNATHVGISATHSGLYLSNAENIQSGPKVDCGTMDTSHAQLTSYWRRSRSGLASVLAS